MVEEGGVEPPFFPNFTMQLSCELLRGLISKKAYQQEGFFTFLLFTFLPLIHFRAPCIPATSKLPGYVARLVVNPVFYLKNLTHGNY